MRYAILTAALVLAAPVAAQTGDQARLVVGMGVGWTGGTDLWSVAQQPISAIGQTNDLFALDRRLRSNLAVSGQVTYFPRNHVGLTGEIGYLGLGTADQCRLLTNSGDFTNEAACAAINTTERSASAVSMLGGVTIRALSRGTVQPYARILAGVVFSPRSTVELAPVFGELQSSVLPIYVSENEPEVKTAGALAIGFATSANAGTQLRVEARGTWTRLSMVDGPTAIEGLVPATFGRWVMVPTVTVGFDLVLEKRRGRRY